MTNLKGGMYICIKVNTAALARWRKVLSISPFNRFNGLPLKEISRTTCKAERCSA